MKERFLIQDLVSPSLRFKARETTVWLREQLKRACLWRWEIVKFSQFGENPYDIIYIGRKTHRKFAMALLNIKSDTETSSTGLRATERRLLVSEMPFPGALCVPSLLSSIIPLGRPLEDITASFHNQLRRDLQKYRTRYRFQQVLESSEIERIDREMLRPYAAARHGESADQIDLEEVKRVAQKYGRLDLLLLEDQIVGCQLAHEFSRAGKRFWTSFRCGYPEAVFSDSKRFRDTNAINIHLAIEWAIENGFDYYDIGVALGRPGDGLLEWKRRRAGELDTMGNSINFHFRLPEKGEAQFLWDAPLFAVERNKLTLHLGLPDGQSDDEVTKRYREMGFRGLYKVYLHSTRPPSEHVLEMFRGLYTQHNLPPVVEIISSS